MRKHQDTFSLCSSFPHRSTDANAYREEVDRFGKEMASVHSVSAHGKADNAAYSSTSSLASLDT